MLREVRNRLRGRDDLGPYPIATISKRSAYGREPIFDAVQGTHAGSEAFTKSLLEFKCDPNVRSIWPGEKGSGQEPLHMAVGRDSFRSHASNPLEQEGIIRTLLTHGANIEAKNTDYRTPLAEAVRNQHYTAATQLAISGADHNAIPRRRILDDIMDLAGRDPNGRVPPALQDCINELKLRQVEVGEYQPPPPKLDPKIVSGEKRIGNKCVCERCQTGKTSQLGPQVAPLDHQRTPDYKIEIGDDGDGSTSSGDDSTPNSSHSG